MPNNNDDAHVMPQLTHELMQAVSSYSQNCRFEFLMPETALFCMLEEGMLGNVMLDYDVRTDVLVNALADYFRKVERVPEHVKTTPHMSSNFRHMFIMASEMVSEQGGGMLLPSTLLKAMRAMEGTPVAHVLSLVPKDTMDAVVVRYEEVCIREEEHPSDDWSDDDDDSDFGNEIAATASEMAFRRVDADEDYANFHFVGRERELRRAFVTLGKEERSNVVFVGDRGVGKTTMLYGIVQYLRNFRKKSKYGSVHVYKVMPSLLSSGMSYAEDFGSHLSKVLGSMLTNSLVILFVGDLVEMVPQNNTDTTPDILRSFLSLIGKTPVRIVATATYEQYKRMSANNPLIEANFSRIDLEEPPVDPDAKEILQGYSERAYAKDGVLLGTSVEKYIIDVCANSYDRALAMPGRAIDLAETVVASTLLDMGRKKVRGFSPRKSASVVQEDVDAVLRDFGYEGIASVEMKADKLRTLETDLLGKIYGQDEAVHGVAQTVLMAKAGLTDETKPLATYLFVGPTGVGKTELAKMLAQQLGVKLCRFDMSEFSEQHSVAKLVGSPAGYVGYDDGGQLTDAVRKNPNCVLLFDEIEKAHNSIFNLLLQVMDYAKLTDNKGQKADFSGCIVIMTSNAGARFASSAGLGFGVRAEKSDVMSAELKRVFAPEFLNRLTKVVAFHDMDRSMASKILDRKVGELRSQLEKRKEVSFTLSEEARGLLLEKGFSSQYGAREMDRAIGSLLKPVLMEALLFGKPTKKLSIVADGDHLAVG